MFIEITIMLRLEEVLMSINVDHIIALENTSKGGCRINCTNEYSYSVEESRASILVKVAGARRRAAACNAL